jgi:hypothetical protein
MSILKEHWLRIFKENALMKYESYLYTYIINNIIYMINLIEEVLEIIFIISLLICF